MLEVELDQSDDWIGDQDWQTIADAAVAAAFAVVGFHTNIHISISICLSDDAVVHGLNKEWRGKDKPTNVLSFPMLEAEELGALAKTRDQEILLGDIILAHDICLSEAAEKDIPLASHVTHLIVHGTLHLLGYDHMDDAEAEQMEALEVKALASLGLANPYEAN